MVQYIGMYLSLLAYSAQTLILAAIFIARHGYYLLSSFDTVEPSVLNDQTSKSRKGHISLRKKALKAEYVNRCFQVCHAQFIIGDYIYVLQCRYAASENVIYFVRLSNECTKKLYNISKSILIQPITYYYAAKLTIYMHVCLVI